MAEDRHRCRWFTDGPSGRCPNAQAFPAVRDVPPFCVQHLAELEPWITARAARKGAEADQWIAWARRQAEGAESTHRALGEAPPLLRRPAAAGTA